jgi:hypothetical protein
MEAFCAAFQKCLSGQVCPAFSSFYLTVVNHSPSDNLMDIIVNWTNPFSGSFDIQYARIDNTNTPVFIYVNTPTSPYTISDLPDGQYTVQIRPASVGCSYISLNTPPCTGITSFSAANGVDNTTIEVTYTATPNVEQVQLQVVYPNGGFSTTNYNNGDSISFDVPSNVYGVYSLQLVPICNINTSWLGQSTAPALVDIPEPTSGVTAIGASSLTAGVGIQSVTGITGFSLSGVLVNGATQSGIHVAFANNNLVFNVSGSPTVTDGVDISIGGVFYARVSFTGGAGLYNISNVTATGVQSIELNFNNNA